MRNKKNEVSVTPLESDGLNHFLTKPIYTMGRSNQLFSNTFPKVESSILFSRIRVLIVAEHNVFTSVTLVSTILDILLKSSSINPGCDMISVMPGFSWIKVSAKWASATLLPVKFPTKAFGYLMPFLSYWFFV